MTLEGLQAYVRFGYVLLAGMVLGALLLGVYYGRTVRTAQRELRGLQGRLEVLGVDISAYKVCIAQLRHAAESHIGAGQVELAGLRTRLDAARDAAQTALREAEGERIRADQVAGVLARTTEALIIARGGQASAELDRAAKAERIAELEGWLEAMGVNPLTGPMPIEGGPSNG